MPVSRHPERLWSAAETMERLAISRATLDRLVDRGELVPIRFDRRLRFDPEQVWSMVHAHRHPAIIVEAP